MFHAYIQTVEYLRSIPGVKKDTLNRNEPFDHDHLPQYFDLQVQQRLSRAINKDVDVQKTSTWYQWIIERLKEYKREWLKKMQGSIMVAASVIATTTFQTKVCV